MITMRIDHGLAALIAARDTLAVLSTGDLGQDLLDTVNNIVAWAQAWYGRVGPEPYEGGDAMREKFQAFLQEGHEDIAVVGESYVPTILKSLEVYIELQADMAACMSPEDMRAKGLPPMNDVVSAYKEFVGAYIDTITSPAPTVLAEVEMELG